MFILDGKELRIDVSFVKDGTTYPASWLRNATQAQKDALGITEIQPDPIPNDRIYVVQADPANPGKWISTPRDITQVRATLIADVNAHANGLLSPTDWKIVRAAEGVADCDADTLAYRSYVRQQANLIVGYINASSSAQLAVLNIHDFKTFDQFVAYHAGAPQLPKLRRFTWLQFINLFTNDEQLAIAAAANSVPQIKLWYDKALGASYIDMDDQRTIDGINAVATVFNLITPQRAAEILASPAP